MRMRWLGLIGGVGWLLVVVVVALASGMAAGVATLFAALGLLVVAGTLVLLSVHRQLLRVDARLARRPSPAPAARKPAKAPVATLGEEQVAVLTGSVDKELKRTFRQIEAMQNLYAMIDIRHALPASRGWPASPDLLLFLVDLVDRHRPRVVVECGSGLSTLCLALAMRRFGIDGKVIALEHLDQYAVQTRELLRRHGVDDIAEVRTAPLEPVQVGDVQVDWYARAAWQELADVDLLFVDGPPSKLSPHSRYPSLPFFAERLTPGAHIVLDDYQRTKERDVVKRWQGEYPDHLTLEKIPLEKGAALLTYG